MLKRAVEVLIVAALVAGVAGAYFRVVGAIPVSVMQTQKMSTFDVTGEGKVAVKPDQAEITLGVQKEAASVASATGQVDRVMQDLSAALKKLGVAEKDIKTTNYSVYQNYTERAAARRGAPRPPRGPRIRPSTWWWNSWRCSSTRGATARSRCPTARASR